MYPFLSELSEKADVAISCYPNAGLPNPLAETGFDLGPPDMARYLGDFAKAGLINIAGGCCGNTPEHIAAIAKALEGREPRRLGGGGLSEEQKQIPFGNNNKKGDDEQIKPLRLSGVAAVYAAVGRVHDDRRADQCGRVAEVREAGERGQVRRGRERGAAAGGERRQCNRHLHGRGHDRRRAGDDALPAAAGERAGGGEGSVHGGTPRSGR